MFTRTCPFCNKTLFAFEHYFCSGCGKKLPKDLMKPVKVPKIEKGIQKSSPKSLSKSKFRNFDKKKALGGGLLLVGLMVILLMFLNVIPNIPVLLFNSSAGVNKELEMEKAPEENLQKVLDSGKDFRSGVLGSEGFAQMVPFEAELYMEVSDPKWLLFDTTFFGQELTAVVEKHFDSPFCVFALEDDGYVSWTFIFNNQENLNLEEISNLIQSDYWNYRVISNKVVVTGRDAIFDMVENSVVGKTKNISMNSFYAHGISSISKEGQALVMMSGYKGKKILESILDMQEWQSIAPLISKTLDLGYNEVIIR